MLFDKVWAFIHIIWFMCCPFLLCITLFAVEEGGFKPLLLSINLFTIILTVIYSQMMAEEIRKSLKKIREHRTRQLLGFKE